jgi:hypothetical protein
MAGSSKKKKFGFHPVRLAYQPPASSTLLSEETSHQQPVNSTFISEQTSTGHQPNEQGSSACVHESVCLGLLGKK